MQPEPSLTAIRRSIGTASTGRRNTGSPRSWGRGRNLSVAVGAGGAGKSTILGVLVDAWKTDGRTVFGATVGWKQTAPFAKAGVDADKRASVAAFLKRVERGAL